MLDETNYDNLWRRPDTVSLTGQGCVLAIIDQPLWREHPGYKNNLLDMKSVNGADPEGVSYHGAAVTSIAAGEIGAARDVKIVYRAIETWHGRENCLNNCADALRGLQTYVAAGNRLDGISISLGWKRNEPDASTNIDIIQWFEARNIPVFTTNDRIAYPCGRQGLANDWRNSAWNIEEDQIAIPVDHRLIAHNGQSDINKADGSLYYRCGNGGISWAVPFVAGMFALAREAQPGITREQFSRMLRDTAQTVDFGDGVELPMANISAFTTALMPSLALPQNVRSFPEARR